MFSFVVVVCFFLSFVLFVCLFVLFVWCCFFWGRGVALHVVGSKLTLLEMKFDDSCLQTHAEIYALPYLE